jgi:hypothetical protein
MDLSKVDRLHQALSATLTVAGVEEEATPQEALTGALRLFSHLLAAYVVATDLPEAAIRTEIEAHCRDAAALTRARLLELRDYEPFAADDANGEPA